MHGAWKVRLLVHLGDAGVAVVAVAVALWVWSRVDGYPFTVSFIREHAVWSLLTAAWLLLLWLPHRPHNLFSKDETAAVVVRTTVAVAGLYLSIYFLAPRDLLPRLVVFTFLALVGVMTLVWRNTCWQLSSREAYRMPVAVVGAGANARSLADLLEEMAPHKKVVAFVQDGGSSEPAAHLPAFVVPSADLRRLVADRQVSELFIAHDDGLGPEMVRALVAAQERRVEVVPLHAAYEQLLHRLPLQHLEGSSVLASLAQARRIGPVSQPVHRVVDVLSGCVGCAALVVLLPVIGPAVWLDVGRPIFFCQERVGLAGRRFRAVKFRTMRSDAEYDGPRWARTADARASWFGRFLRRSHLDEIPQFWNVLRGEMSLVGPRPERPEFVDELVRRIPYYRERLLVRPGLTGWAQVNFRYGSSVDDAATKLEYDLYYIKHRSPWFDALIAWQTVWTIAGFSGR